MATKEIGSDTKDKERDSSPQQPPSYNVDSAEEQLQNLSINLNQEKLAAASTDLSDDHVIVHLKLLHAIQDLRNDVSNQDDLWNISDSFLPPPKEPGTPLSKDAAQVEAARKKIQEKRWAVFVARASKRFELWWSALRVKDGGQPIRLGDFEKDRASILGYDTPRIRGEECLTTDQLPPLDVLMVWHAFMLNPRCYLEDCLRQGMMKFWHQGMPWAAVDAAIDSSGYYDPGELAQANFRKSVGCLEWNNVQDPLELRVHCPKCYYSNIDHQKWFQNPLPTPDKLLKVPWTSVGSGLAREREDLELYAAGAGTDLDKLHHRLDDIFSAGNGYADLNFTIICSKCQAFVNHDVLRANKFVRDMMQFYRPTSPPANFSVDITAQVIPMPGTVLDKYGQPIGMDRLLGMPRNLDLFPNRMCDALVNFDRMFVRPSFEFHMNRLRNLVEDKLKIYEFLAYCQSDFHARQRRINLHATERVAIRRMFSRYWDNSSPFALDLVGAVIRQGSFIQKMVGFDWLHSPTLSATAKRVLTKYSRFMTILAANTDKMAVPTLDVDLGWHTHQLAPLNYYKSTTEKTNGTFVDHDDKVPETKLNDAFKRTSEQYQRLFGEPYSQCACWYCESIRASHTSSVTRLVSPSSISQINSQLHDAPTNPDQSAHISAHNAIQPRMRSNTYEAQRDKQMKKLRAAFDKACRRARRDGRPEPKLPPYLDDKKKRDKRDDDTTYAYAYAYGMGFYPVVPYYGYDYAPYMCDPGINTGAYAANPACANMESGAYGACCQGACGGGVAAGACGSDSGAGGAGIGAGCGGSGGSGGGCGGGGGGGCGGGGGGCGGGGGGG